MVTLDQPFYVLAHATLISGFIILTAIGALALISAGIKRLQGRINRPGRNEEAR